jgi:uncharacterized membrane protein
MQGLLLLVCIIILIVVLIIKSDLSTNLKALREKLNFLDQDIQRLKFQKQEEKPSITIEPTIITTQPKPVEPIKEPRVTPKPILEEEPFEQFKKPPVSEKKPEPVLEPIAEVITEPVYTPPSPPKPGFFERNPDLEKFIGENLANKIGIGILVIGIGFFVKYAIDQNWIHEIGRVLIGIVCGGGLLGLAHYMRNKFSAFSSVLVGGGIAVLYLTITIGFQEYQIFNQTSAFIIMIGITAFTIALALGYNRIELAVVAILGGFGSPFMVSTGEGNYIVLFTYILTLNVGMLVLAYYKKWNLVNIVSYAFTIILFASWLIEKFDGQNLRLLNWGLFFSTAFYLIFFGMNIINNLKERRPFKALDFSMLLSNTFLYYSAGMYMLSFDYGYLYRGLFTTSLAVFNFIFAFLLYKNQKVDRNLVFLLIGLVLTFLSLAAPVQLEGNYITLFWAAEGVLLLWLSQKSGIQLMRLASMLVNVLMVISLVMDWYNLYFLAQSTNYSIILNRVYVTGFVSFASLLITNYLLRSETEERLPMLQAYKALIMIAAIGACYGFNLLELQYQMQAFEVEDTAFKIVTGTYNMAFILGLILVSRFISMHADVRTAFVAWGAIGIFMYLVGYHQAILEARDLYLVSGEMTTGFYFHYLLVLLLLTICVSTIGISRKLTEFNKNSRNIYSWVLVAFFVFITSYELDHLVALVVYQDGDSLTHILNQNHKIGWPILWGVGSFLLISIGFKQKIRHLRIISLVLFLITLLKLFIIDIKGISEGGKIAAFISLGILLLIISFMYQRLKKLLLTDDAATSNEPESKS